MIDTTEDFKFFSIFILYIAVVTWVPEQAGQPIILLAISVWAIYHLWAAYQTAAKKKRTLSENGRYVFNLKKDVWIGFLLTVISIIVMLMTIAAIHYLDSYKMWMTIGGNLLIYLIVVSVGTYFSKRSDAY